MIYSAPPPAIYSYQIPSLTAAEWKYVDSLDTRVRRMAMLLVTECKRQGIHIIITAGTRTAKEQQRLYDQGRTAPGPIVTNAKPGGSYHNYGLAFDFCIDKPGDWFNPKLMESVGWIGKVKIGLEWGGDFKTIKDESHFQWTGGLSIRQLLQGLRP